MILHAFTLGFGKVTYIIILLAIVLYWFSHEQRYNILIHTQETSFHAWSYDSYHTLLYNWLNSMWQLFFLHVTLQSYWCTRVYCSWWKIIFLLSHALNKGIDLEFWYNIYIACKFDHTISVVWHTVGMRLWTLTHALCDVRTSTEICIYMVTRSTLYIARISVLRATWHCDTLSGTLLQHFSIFIAIVWLAKLL